MSLESAKAFVKKIQEDKEFAKSFFACNEPKARKSFIKDNGFEFTKEEVEEISLIEIDESKIQEISGGSCCGRNCESESVTCCANWDWFI